MPENQRCNVCNSEEFTFKVVINKTTLKPKKEECNLTCAHCKTPATVVGGKLTQ